MADTDSREAKHVTIINQLDALDAEINRLADIVLRVQNGSGSVAEPQMADHPKAPTSLSDVLSSTPQRIAEATDKLQKLEADLEGLLF